MSAGKGSKPRPLSVDRQTFESNWERAFGGCKAADSDDTPRVVCPACNGTGGFTIEDEQEECLECNGLGYYGTGAAR